VQIHMLTENFSIWKLLVSSQHETAVFGPQLASMLNEELARLIKERFKVEAGALRLIQIYDQLTTQGVCTWTLHWQRYGLDREGNVTPDTHSGSGCTPSGYPVPQTPEEARERTPEDVRALVQELDGMIFTLRREQQPLPSHCRVKA
jgi:ribosomal protein L29